MNHITYQITIPGESEKLGHDEYDYQDRIVMSEDYKNGAHGYNIRPLDIGDIEIMIIPTQRKQ